MLVATVTEVVAAFLRGRCGASAVNDLQIQQAVIMKPAHRASKDGIGATIGLPATKHPVDARVVDFRTSFCIPFDWQHLPLAAHVQHLQDVVEDRVQGQRRRWAAPAQAQMG
jgi:nitrate reductase beta subunit